MTQGDRLLCAWCGKPLSAVEIVLREHSGQSLGWHPQCAKQDPVSPGEWPWSRRVATVESRGTGRVGDAEWLAKHYARKLSVEARGAARPYYCSGCGKRHSETQLVRFSGRFICKDCVDLMAEIHSALAIPEEAIELRAAEAKKREQSCEKPWFDDDTTEQTETEEGNGWGHEFITISHTDPNMGAPRVLAQFRMPADRFLETRSRIYTNKTEAAAELAYLLVCRRHKLAAELRAIDEGIAALWSRVQKDDKGGVTAQGKEAWRDVPPIPRSQGEQLASSRKSLQSFLAEQFKSNFHRNVEEVMLETFPDGLFATLYVSGADSTDHNVWGVSMSSALADAGVEVNVVVRPESDRLWFRAQKDDKKEP